MKFHKCPRCELNYILDDAELCAVCHEEVHGRAKQDEPALCSVCGVARPMHGQDMCPACLSEFRTVQVVDAVSDDADDEEAVSARELEDAPVSAMEDVELPLMDLDDDGDMDMEDDEETPAEEPDKVKLGQVSAL